MKYKVTHTTKYTYSEAVPVCHNLVHLAPRPTLRQQCRDSRLLIHPEPLLVSVRTDYFGNEVSYFSIEQPHRGLTVTATSLVELSPRPPVDWSATSAWDALAAALREDRAADVLDASQFVPDSPSVSTSDALSDYASESFPPGRPVLEGLMELTKRIHGEFVYDPQATTITTPVEQVFRQRRGVCQDFAHLQIGCVRSLGLAVRYVSGYLRTLPPPGKPRLVGADASHAWLSVYCGEIGWVDVDPTNGVITSTDHITVAWGRDYHDVCPVQGVIVGGGDHKLQVSVDVTPGEADS